jgi:hypothetical protein
MSSIPAPDADNLNWLDRINQIQQAVRARCAVAGELEWWPQPVRTWVEGTVPSNITETTFTDAGQPWDPDFDNPWVPIDVDPDTDGWQTPTSWRLVIDDCDYTKVVQADITSIATGGVLTYDNLRDFVTAGVIPSIASLIGKEYFATRQGTVDLSGRAWWSDQLLEWSNVRAYGLGTVTGATTSTIEDANAPGWHADELVGKDLLVYGDDGFLTA